MPIHVICTSCKTAFQVSEKFAGKKGPCPKCKNTITIPLPQEDIVIHAPEVEGPKDTTGRPVFMPILREETKLSTMAIVGIVTACLLVLLVAVAFRFISKNGPPSIFLVLGALGLAPPLGVAGYAFVRDQELQPYRGMELWGRVAVSSAIYALLWAVYIWIPGWFGIEGPPYEIWTLVYIVPPIVAIGGFTAYVTYDVELATGFMHYALYLAVTVLLCFIANATFYLLPAG